MTKKELFGKVLDLGKWTVILFVVFEVVAAVGLTSFLWQDKLSTPAERPAVVTPETDNGCVLIGFEEVCPR